MSAIAARVIGAKPDEVLIANTGVIGVQLPMDAIRVGMKK